MENKNKEKVIHPEHYNMGKIEMWDYAYDHKLDFFERNLVKYITRCKHKNVLQELYKCKESLDKLIQLEENKIN